jgi:hypothetical protein
VYMWCAHVHAFVRVYVGAHKREDARTHVCVCVRPRAVWGDERGCAWGVARGCWGWVPREGLEDGKWDHARQRLLQSDAHTKPLSIACATANHVVRPTNADCAELMP